MGSGTAQFMVHLLGFAAFLWHGLYVLTRGNAGPVARLTGATMLVTAALFGLGGLLEAMVGSASLDAQVTVDRLSWCTAVAPAAMWLHLCLRLQPGALGTRDRMFIWGAYAAAAVLIVLGTFTDAVRGYAASATLGYLDTAGPLYIVFVAYLFICTGLASVALLRAAVPAEARLAEGAAARLMVAGSLLFMAGAGSYTIQKLQGNNTDQFVPWLVLLIGLLAMAGAVAIRSNLLLGTDVRRDFVYNATSLLLLLGPYLAISALLAGFAQAHLRQLALASVALITASHALHDKARDWLDAAFFAKPVREERAAARAYAEALATQPVGPSPALASQKAFDDAARRAISHLSDPTKLAMSPLLNLRVVALGVAEQGQEDNRLNRAAVLKEMLIELLAGLKPAEGSGAVTGDAYRYYNCLYYPYVRGVSRRRGPTFLRQLQERRQRDGTPPTDLERVIQWLVRVDEDTYYKWQRRGSDAIATVLREREAAVGCAVPWDGAGLPIADIGYQVTSNR
jgi:hypothetical protein